MTTDTAHNIDKSRWYQPSGPARFTSAGWVPVEPPPPTTKAGGDGIVLFVIVILAVGLGLIALGGLL